MSDTRDIVRTMVRKHAPEAWQSREIADDVPLGSGGLGMDSIDLAELLLDVEDAIGVTYSGGDLPQEVLTIGGLVDFFGTLRAANAEPK